MRTKKDEANIMQEVGKIVQKEKTNTIMEKNLESDVLRSVCEYLELKGHFFWRTNNIPVSTWRGGKQVYFNLPKYTPRGLPDIMIVRDGWFIALEIKNYKGQQSPHQKEFQKKLADAGGEYYLIRSIDDLKEVGL